MGIGFALIAVGAVFAFTFTGEVLGVDADTLGVVLMMAGAFALVFGIYRRSRARGQRPTSQS